MLFFFSSDCYNWLSGPISVGFFVLLICTPGFWVFFFLSLLSGIMFGILFCAFSVLVLVSVASQGTLAPFIGEWS